MKLVLILRHAKSSWKHPDLNDHDRPLNKRGKRDAPRMGELLLLSLVGMVGMVWSKVFWSPQDCHG
jgi:phosphohistidine phosphatase SixA